MEQHFTVFRCYYKHGEYTVQEYDERGKFFPFILIISFSFLSQDFRIVSITFFAVFNKTAAILMQSNKLEISLMKMNKSN